MYDTFDASLAAALGILLAILAVGVSALRAIHRRRFDLADVFLVSLGFVYGVGYALVMHVTSTGDNGATGARIARFEGSFWVIPTLEFLAFIAGRLMLTLWSDKPRRPRLLVSDDEIGMGRLHLLAWGFLVVSLCSFLLYVRAYGGVAGYFEMAVAIRSGWFDLAGDNPYAFLFAFNGLAFFASYLFAACTLALPRGYKRAVAIAGFVIAMAVSTTVLVGRLGRVDLLTYWATMLFAFAIYRYGLAVRLMAWGAALVLAILAMMPQVSSWLDRPAAAGVVEFFSYELAFPVESALNTLELDEYRLGKDIALAPIFLLPERIWNVQLGIRTLSDRNSENLLGAPISDGFGYTFPADMLTTGLYQAGHVGPIILVAIFCILLMYLDRFLVYRFPRALSAFLYSHAVFSIAALSTLYADPRMVVMRNFQFLVGISAIWFFGAFLWKRTAQIADARLGRRRSFLESLPASSPGM